MWVGWVQTPLYCTQFKQHVRTRRGEAQAQGLHVVPKPFYLALGTLQAIGPTHIWALLHMLGVLVLLGCVLELQLCFSFACPYLGKIHICCSAHFCPALHSNVALRRLPRSECGPLAEQLSPPLL